MERRPVTCTACGHDFEIGSHIRNYSCNECGHMHLEEKSAKALMEAKEQVSAATHSTESPTVFHDRIGEAEQYSLKAQFILNGVQANVSVYGSNSAWSGAQPEDVDLALKYINRSLEIWPDNPNYLNLKALLLIEGKGDRENGLELLRKAAQLAPDDITIQDNLEKSQQQQCFIATATYGESAWQVAEFRHWRDTKLLKSSLGRQFIRFYYTWSPTLAEWVKQRPQAKRISRRVLNSLANKLKQDRLRS